MRQRIQRLENQAGNTIALVTDRTIGDQCLLISYSAFEGITYKKDLTTTTIVYPDGKEEIFTYFTMDIITSPEHL